MSINEVQDEVIAEFNDFTTGWTAISSSSI